MMSSETFIITLMLCICSFLVGAMFYGYMQGEHERALWMLMEDGERIFADAIDLFERAVKAKKKARRKA